MWDWIGAVFSGFLSVFVPGGVVRDALIRLVNSLLSMFKPWVAAAENFAGWYRLFINRVWIMAWRTVALAEWLVSVALPRTVAQAFSRATAWAGQEINSLRNAVSGLIATLTGWVVAEFARWGNLVTGWVTAVRDNLASLWARFLVVERRVVQLLTDPRAFSDWAAGEIVGAIGRWAYPRAELFARWLLPRAVGLAVRGADLAERILVDLFM